MKTKLEAVSPPAEEFQAIWTGKVDIKQINEDIELQVRKDGIDMDVVKDYTAALEDPMDDLPALAVFTEAEEYNKKAALLLSDGFHRLESYKIMKRNLIPVTVFRGDKTAAIVYAIQSNGKHGKPFTKKDREHAVRILLATPDTAKWTVRKIADTVGCSKSTVQNIKNPPEPKRTTKKSTTVETPATPITPFDLPDGSVSSATPEPERFAPGIAVSFPSAAPPSAMPVMVHERAESTLETNTERVLQLKAWIAEGAISRGDVMNLFATDEGRLVWVKRSEGKKRMLMVYHGKELLIEAEVTLEAESTGLLSVSVDNPHLVEFSAADDPFAASRAS